MNLLISVKPYWAEQIANGQKLWELRKLPPREGVKNVIIYATAPYSKIVAIAPLIAVVKGTPFQIWDKNIRLGNVACITNKAFWEYYGEDRGKAVALVLMQVQPLNILLAKIKELKPRFHPPQSYVYLRDEDELAKACRLDSNIQVE